MRNYQKIIETLVDFLQKKVKEKGFKSVVFGLSGGIELTNNKNINKKIRRQKTKQKNKKLKENKKKKWKM